jgi:hypothetical protein
MEDQVWRQPLELVPLERVAKLVRRLAIVLGEDRRERDLGDDVLLDRVLEERRLGKVECEEEERRPGRLGLCKEGGTEKRSAG